MSAIRDEFDAIPDSELQETFYERVEGTRYNECNIFQFFCRSRRNVPRSCALGSFGKCVLVFLGSERIGKREYVSKTMLNVIQFNITRSTVWVISTTSLIAFLPYIIEKERSDLEKTQVAQQRQMLLGPSAAIQQAKTV